jgi:hypothetical protein
VEALKIPHLAQGENEEWRLGAPFRLPVLNGLAVEWVRQPMSPSLVTEATDARDS